MMEKDRTPSNQPEKREEQDADDVIRAYEEGSAGAEPSAERQEEEDESADVPWYDQARQDTKEPAQAVLTGGDIDAAWDQASTLSGEETVGGSTPTPDQDIVEELGQALGVTYQDNEPLHPTEKIEQRDVDRWELNPASSEDYAERSRLPQDGPPGVPQPERAPKRAARKPAKRTGSAAKRKKKKAA